MNAHNVASCDTCSTILLITEDACFAQLAGNLFVVVNKTLKKYSYDSTRSRKALHSANYPTKHSASLDASVYDISMTIQFEVSFI